MTASAEHTRGLTPFAGASKRRLVHEAPLIKPSPARVRPQQRPTFSVVCAVIFQSSAYNHVSPDPALLIDRPEDTFALQYLAHTLNYESAEWNSLFWM